MERPDGNIVVLTFAALLSCLVICETVKTCFQLVQSLQYLLQAPGFFCRSQPTDLSYYERLIRYLF